jgi:defect-in-organelle-trafficking protein DotD
MFIRRATFKSVRLSLFLVCLTSVILGACAGIPLKRPGVTDYNDGATQVVAPPDKVTALLADAADRAAVALETLSAIEHARSPGVSVAPVSGAPMELRRAITVDWVGPADHMVQTLANRAGYNFAVVGSAPLTPIIVSLDVQNRPVIEALRDLGLQMGARADVTVDSARRIVELHYPPTPGLGATL